MPSIPAEIWSLVANRVDWQRPELAALKQQRDAGDLRSAVLGLVKQLRARATPKPGFTADYYALVRSQATPAQKDAAAKRWHDATQRELTMPYHNNTYAALGPDTIALAGTPERCEAMAARILSLRKEWPGNRWGFGETAGVALLLTYLWNLAECSNECLVPIFGWLIEQSDAEWLFMRRLPESVLGTSGHNWYAHSFEGFFVMGFMWPEFTGFGRFCAFGTDYLERELSVLFEDDGWSKEGASGYHEFAFSSLVHLAHLAEINGIPLSEKVRSRLRLIAESSWRMVGPDGCFPLFGDDGRAHAGNTLRVRAAMFNLPIAKFVAEATDPNWHRPIGQMLPGEGRDLMAEYNAVKSEPPPSLDTALTRSGLYAMRTAWTPNADFLAVLAGPLGSLITSHKHADIFTIELQSRGRRILVDNGYGAEVPELKDSKQYRMWRVGGAAHNTVTIDGQSCVPIRGEFRFRGMAAPFVEAWQSEAKYSYFSGVHESFRHLPEEVSAVRRKIFFLRGRYWIIIDRFTPETEAEHEYQLHFQLGVPAELNNDGSVVTSGEGGNLLIAPVPGATGPAKMEPCPYPIASGYDNPSHLWYTRKAKTIDSFVTVLVPFDQKPPEVATRLLDVQCDGRTLESHEATGLEVIINGERHVYFDNHMHWNLPWTCGGFSGDGRLFHSAIK